MSQILFENDPSSTEKISQRIINGKPVRITEYPFYVLVDTDRCYCGGVLLSENVVLTAAHCVAKSRIRKIRVIPGLNRRDQPKRRVYRPKKVVVHPKYKKNRLFDVALIILSCSVNLCRCVDLIEISPVAPDEGTRVTVVGYGYTRCDQMNNGKVIPSPSKYLRSSQRKIVCYNGPLMITRNKKSRTCLGDSGSPVICDGELVAVHIGGDWFCGSTSYHVTLSHPQIRCFLAKNLERYNLDF